MDDDPVLRSIGADLERDDPALAALLSAGPVHRHTGARLTLVVGVLLIPALLIPALLLPGRVTLGLLAVLLIVGSPVLVAWLCAGSPPAPDAPA
ncbi:MAG TPA: hypothetical protein VGN28_03025 [Blastococcus sp.]|nr:hypothetical protein [Blastococcus sp.]